MLPRDRAVSRQYIHLLTKIGELHFLQKEELSHSSDLFCMLIDMDCLSYEYEYVLTVARSTNLDMKLRPDTG